MERDGKFALSVYSQSAQKIALVGTLVRVNECKYLEDGQMMVLVEGLSRLFVKQITSDRPFIIAKVQNFHDYSLATSEQLDMLERKVFRLAKVNMQVRLSSSHCFLLSYL